MLPEVLSNGLCSLNPHVPRLCLVAEMEFDFQGQRPHQLTLILLVELGAQMGYAVKRRRSVPLPIADSRRTQPCPHASPTPARSREGRQ